MGARRKSYTPKYRRGAARLVIDTGRTIAEVARELGVGEQLLGRWVAAERARMDDPPETLDVDERAELERLRRENAVLRMDRELLRRFAATVGQVVASPAFTTVILAFPLLVPVFGHGSPAERVRQAMPGLEDGPRAGLWRR